MSQSLQKRPKKLLDQACIELVEVSAKSSAGNTTPFARKKPMWPGSSASSSSMASDIQKTWARPKRCPELVEGSRPSSPIWPWTDR